ncbi:MAG: FMN-binding protein [Desulfosarcinaceae bacterium]|nr:FMN-binding protein [Desulfosarcinaceae bacterium]
MSDTLRSIRFALIVAVVCSFLLTAAAMGLQPLQERNMQVDRQKNILKAVGLVSAEERPTAEAIAALYGERIRCLWTDQTGRILAESERGTTDLPICLHVDNNRIEDYVIPINTSGLWGQIQGYLAVSNDGATITGFTVFKHSETPGLGGEIEQDWFQRNFVGKKIVNAQGQFSSIGIAKGKVAAGVPAEKAANYVDGISGATLTGKYLSAGFRRILADYEPVAVQFRKDLLPKEHLPLR